MESSFKRTDRIMFGFGVFFWGGGGLFFLQVKSAKASLLLNVISESREAKKPDFETKTESLKGRQYKRFEQEGFHWSMAQVSNSDETKS